MGIKTKDGEYEVVLCSNTQFENITAEIWIDDEVFARITMENGFENLELELFPIFPKKQASGTHNFDSVSEALSIARMRLADYR